MASSSQTVRGLDSELSATNASHSRVQLPITRQDAGTSPARRMGGAGWPLAASLVVTARPQLASPAAPARSALPRDRCASCWPHGPRAAIGRAGGDSRTGEFLDEVYRPVAQSAVVRALHLSTPAFRSSRKHLSDDLRPRSSRRALPLSSQQVLQRHVVQHRVRQHPLEPGGLLFKRLQPPRLRHMEPAELGLPFVKGPVTPTSHGPPALAGF